MNNDVLAVNDSEPQSEDTETVVRAFLAQGKIINAVKHVRSMTGLDLFSSQQYVYRIKAIMNDEKALQEARSYIDLQAELAALRRQVRVLEHDRRMLQDALVELAPDKADKIMNDIRASSPKEATDATE